MTELSKAERRAYDEANRMIARMVEADIRQFKRLLELRLTNPEISHRMALPVKDVRVLRRYFGG